MVLKKAMSLLAITVATMFALSGPVWAGETEEESSPPVDTAPPDDGAEKSDADEGGQEDE